MKANLQPIYGLREMEVTNIPFANTLNVRHSGMMVAGIHSFLDPGYHHAGVTATINGTFAISMSLSPTGS